MTTPAKYEFDPGDDATLEYTDFIGMHMNGVNGFHAVPGSGPMVKEWTTESGDFTVQQRWLNLYNFDPAPRYDRTTKESTPTGRVRGVGPAREREVKDTERVERCFLLERRYEWWKVDQDLQSYYKAVAHPLAGATVTGAGIAAANVQGTMISTGSKTLAEYIATQAIGKVAPDLAALYGGSVAVAGGLFAFGAGIFLTTSALMEKYGLPAGEKTSEGWAYRHKIWKQETPTETLRWEPWPDTDPAPTADDAGTPWWRWLLGAAVATLLLAGVAGGVEAVSGGGNAPASHGPAVKATGAGPVYELRGEVTGSSNCGAKAPRVGQKERATITLKLDHGKLLATVGATSDLPSNYAEYDGHLYHDGSFQLTAHGYLPADIHAGQINGRLTDDGKIAGGPWLVGIPGTLPHNIDDPACVVTIGHLDSSFYFGVTSFDWKREWLHQK